MTSHISLRDANRLQEMVDEYESELARARGQLRTMQTATDSMSPLGETNRSNSPFPGTSSGGLQRVARESFGVPMHLHMHMLREGGIIGGEMNFSGRSSAGSLVGSEAMSMAHKSETAARMVEDFFQSSYTIDKFLRVRACMHVAQLACVRSSVAAVYLPRVAIQLRLIKSGCMHYCTYFLSY